MKKLAKKAKMPKQFYYWLQKLKIKREKYRGRGQSEYYFQDSNYSSNGRRYRLIKDGDDGFIFEISEKKETFDRWANSREVSIYFNYDVKEKTFIESVKYFLDFIEENNTEELDYPTNFSWRK